MLLHFPLLSLHTPFTGTQPPQIDRLLRTLDPTRKVECVRTLSRSEPRYGTSGRERAIGTNGPRACLE